MKKAPQPKLRRKAITARIPSELYHQLHRLVKEGWYRHDDDVIEEALRRFLSTHTPEEMEKAILEDVEWGLRGGK